MRKSLSVLAGVCASFSLLFAPFGEWSSQHLSGSIMLFSCLAAVGVIYVLFDAVLRQRHLVLSPITRKDLRLVLLIMLPVLLVEMGYALLIERYFAPGAFSGDLPKSWPWLIGLLVVAPVLEELVFRAWLLGDFWSARSKWFRVAVSIFGFSLLHLWFVPGDADYNVMQLFRYWDYVFVTAAFVLIWFKTRSLWACAIAHLLANICAFIA